MNIMWCLYIDTVSGWSERLVRVVALSPVVFSALISELFPVDVSLGPLDSQTPTNRLMLLTQRGLS